MACVDTITSTMTVVITVEEQIMYFKVRFVQLSIQLDKLDFEILT